MWAYRAIYNWWLEMDISLSLRPGVFTILYTLSLQVHFTDCWCLRACMRAYLIACLNGCIGASMIQPCFGRSRFFLVKRFAVRKCWDCAYSAHSKMLCQLKLWNYCWCSQPTWLYAFDTITVRITIAITITTISPPPNTHTYTQNWLETGCRFH